MSRRRRAGLGAALVALSGLALLASGALPGCIAPPAILPGGQPDLDLAPDRFPPRAELVEVPVGDGDVLRGVFVPSDPGAPVVLHLLESSGSVTSRKLPHDGVLAGLTHAGYASLMLDYRGVGSSSGSRSTSNLRADAAAMWDEAVRRAGGDPGLVVVRATSIGTIAAALLARDGAEPAAWILIAPVRAETAVRRFAAWKHPGLLGQIASALFRPIADVDLVATVRGIRQPLWVIAPERDVLIAPDELALLREAVEAAGGTWTTSKSGHEFTTVAAHRLWGAKEVELLVTRFPGWPDREARGLAVLDSLPSRVAARFPEGGEERRRLAEVAVRAGAATAEAIAAAALAFEDPAEAAAFLRPRPGKDAGWLGDLRFDDLERLLDLRDPSGDLPAALVLSWADHFRIVRSQGDAGACRLEPRAILELLWESEREAAAGSDAMHEIPLLGGLASTRYPCGELWSTLRGAGAPAIADLRRRAARVLLKAAAVPERVVDAGDGAFQLEAFDGREWRAIALDGGE